MTTEPTAVQQAVKLLTDRHDELGRIITDATSERQSVAAALTSLGVSVDRENAAVVADLAALVSGPAFGTGGSVTVGRRSVRVVALETLDSADRVFSNDDLFAALVNEFPDRDEDQLRANLRSALFQLRKTDDVVQVAPGVHVSRRWRPQNAEGPAVDAAGPSDVSNQLPEGGEHTDGQGSHHDHRVDLGGRNGDRDHLGAPVGH